MYVYWILSWETILNIFYCTYQTAEGSHRRVYHHQLKCSLCRIWETICGQMGWCEHLILWALRSERVALCWNRTYWWKGTTSSSPGLGAVPRAPSARQRTVHPEPRKGGSNWAMSPFSRYRSPPEVELSNIWLVLHLANNEPKDTEWSLFCEMYFRYSKMHWFLLFTKSFWGDISLLCSEGPGWKAFGHCTSQRGGWIRTQTQTGK